MSTDTAEPLALTSGFHDLTAEQYHADPCIAPSLSSSIAKVLLERSPKHAWLGHPKLGGKCARDQSDEMRFGEIAHSLMLGKGAKVAVLENDSWRGKDAAAFWDAAVARGEIPALTKEFVRSDVMVKEARRQLVDMGITAFEPSDDARSEVTAIWQDSGVWCRALLDRLIIREKAGVIEIHDLKTMGQSAHPKACAARIASMDYDLQQAHYTQGVQKLRPDMAGRIKWTFHFVEVAAPYSVTPVQLNGEWATIGVSKYSRAIDLWRECITSGIWPSYTKEIVTVEAPAWALPAELAA